MRRLNKNDISLIFLATGIHEGQLNKRFVTNYGQQLPKKFIPVIENVLTDKILNTSEKYQDVNP